MGHHLFAHGPIVRVRVALERRWFNFQLASQVFDHLLAAEFRPVPAHMADSTAPLCKGGDEEKVVGRGHSD